MVNLSNNADIVLSTMEKYRYGPRALAISKRCMEELSREMEKRDERTFSTEYALEWCDQSVVKYLKKQYRMTIYRLDDVYKHGRVLGNHIVIYQQPAEAFRLVIDDYLAEVSRSENHTEIHMANIRHAVTHFCCFEQYNGVESPDDIDYDDLDAFDSFMRESAKTFYIKEGLTVGFLGYMSNNGRCSKGFPLYMHYIESDKVSRMSGLSYSAREAVALAQRNHGGISSHDLYESISDFTNQMIVSGYSCTVTESAPYHLTLLFLFLDREGLRYNRETVEIWFREEGDRLFKKGIYMARRTYEMYDDYLREGVLMPYHWWKRSETAFDRLPLWSQEWIKVFLSTKEREGWKSSTIKMYSLCTTAFCAFLSSAGVCSFEELTPKLIKEYNAWDCNHATPEAKNAYNSRIRKFLIYLEINGIIPMGMHYSLPNGAAFGEKIVEVLSDTDVLAIEKYCEEAKTPLQLRDAAMLMLLTETGFRSCDIVGLETTDIDWKQRSIRIIQMKTGVGHLHPMNTKTGNQIYRYIKEARPRNTGSRKLFLTVKAPYGPIGHMACSNAMKRAGTSTTKTHRARKGFASSTLNGGATFAETAEMLGHSDTSSVHKYTQLDAERMRLCPLSLSETGLLLDGRY